MSASWSLCWSFGVGTPWNVSGLRSSVLRPSRCVRGGNAAMVVMGRRGLDEGADVETIVILAARNKAVEPLRKRRNERMDSERDQYQAYAEEPTNNVRRSDVLAPRREGVWALIPYLALTALIGFIGYFGSKRFLRREKGLVEEFGTVLAVYGTTDGAARSIVNEYRQKLGPGLFRGKMFASFAKALVENKAAGPSSIAMLAQVRTLLGLSETKAIRFVNEAGENLKTAPSVLGKLLFVAERAFSSQSVSELKLRSLFPYSDDVLSELQQNMAERVFNDICEEAIRDSNSEDESIVPFADAATLRVSEQEALRIFRDLVGMKQRTREKAEEERLKEAAAQAEGADRPSSPELDFPARSAEPAKAIVHAYQCGDCGYTMYPAAGREFKFFGSDFVCPACGAPKDKFVDVNAAKED